MQILITDTAILNWIEEHVYVIRLEGAGVTIEYDSDQDVLEHNDKDLRAACKFAMD